MKTGGYSTAEVRKFDGQHILLIALDKRQGAG